MKKTYARALIYCFIYFVIFQFVHAISQFILDCNLNNLNSFISFANYFRIILLVVAAIIVFIFLKGIKLKDLYSAAKIIIKKHWIKYALIILLVFSLSSNVIIGEGEIAKKILLSNLFYNPSLVARFASRCVIELFMSEEATIFFMFVPFICHVIVYIKSKGNSK